MLPNVVELFASARKQLLTMLFPIFCIGCNREGEWLCTQCRVAMPALTLQRCLVCRVVQAHGAVCAEHRLHAVVAGVVAYGEFHDWHWQQLLHVWKYQGARELDGLFADVATALVPALPGTIEVIVPLPLTLRRERSRGFNQAAILADAIAQATGLPIVPSLKRVRETPHQARLTPEQRRRNLRAAFVASEEVQGRNCLLVDDIVTTGYTMRAAAEALKQAGASEVWGAAISRSSLELPA